MNRRRTVMWGIGVGVLLAAVVFIVHLLATPTPVPPDVDLAGVPMVGQSMGLASAPILVEVFSDFQCSWCARGAQAFEREVLAEYLRRGEVRVEFRHFTVVDVNSYWASMGAACAARQDAFWPYHDRLFAAQEEARQGAFAITNLKRYAVELGLDEETFGTCLTGEQEVARLRADHQSGEERGVEATPTYIINGRIIEGLVTRERFRQIAVEELAKKR